ncbi:YoaK family protein [Noviherbaspirillum sp.]|uniref:YoaK family protein n=1 Tax=Noviherbaspirillum sp. TaxID=1926288 RepID=UPI002B490995|nr:YoaK family protein [Noviherbaspirillum sp.]HJV79810.1 YoaK family protein [Noviherbaspirillum sp.]
MPINYLASLTAPERSARANLHLGVSLAFVAGALNAGGFLAIGQYTSHMTGMLSTAADFFVLGNLEVVGTAFLSVLSFAGGAASTAIMVNYSKRNTDRNIYMPPLLVEAVLLLVFGLMGANLQMHEFINLSLTAVLLCYVMGLQNALVTKISNAEIRTTHVTGLVTDIGIELGKLFYWNRHDSDAREFYVLANRTKLRVHLMLVTSFFCGGVVGAMGFKHIGFATTIPLAIGLVLMSFASMFKPND